MSTPIKVAAVHAAPVFLDRAATTAKAISLLREAAKAGAQLIAFPETYIPAFPVWALRTHGRAVGGCQRP
jgi:aliphatic nitrilase